MDRSPWPLMRILEGWRLPFRRNSFWGSYPCLYKGGQPSFCLGLREWTKEKRYENEDCSALCSVGCCGQHGPRNRQRAYLRGYRLRTAGGSRGSGPRSTSGFRLGAGLLELGRPSSRVGWWSLDTRTGGPSLG